MQTEQVKLSPLEHLKAYIAVRKTWPVEKQREEDEMLHTNKEAYLPKYRRITWADSEEAKLAFCKRPVFGDFEYDEAQDQMSLADAQERVCALLRRMEHETADQYRETYNGLVYLEGLRDDQLAVEELATPEPPEKTPKYF